MIELTPAKEICSLVLDQLKGGSTMKGSVYHLKGICSFCREGDKNTLKHPHHYVQLYLSYLPKKNHKLTGREKRKPFSDGIDAWIYLREIQRFIDDKTFIPWNYRGNAKSITVFENFFDRFKGQYRDFRKYFTPLLSKDIAQIDRIEVKRFYRNLPPELKQSSKNLILKILRATLSEAYQEGFIDFVPAFPRRESEEKPVKNALTWDEQMQVIENIKRDHQLLFLFLACHGKRVAEALSLKWEDIDFKHKTFKVYESKVKNNQLLPIHEEFLGALPFAGAINKSGPVFHPYKNCTLNLVLKTACRKARIKEVTTHEFGRHSFISQRLNSGFTNEQVALVTNNLSSIGKYRMGEKRSKRRNRKLPLLRFGR